jgi:hypothetical protein
MFIAVDFDGTIVQHKYPEIGEEIPFAIDTLKLIQFELRHHLILWTVREGRLLDDAVRYCRERGLEFYAVNKNHPEDKDAVAPRKLMADLFIDDRNIGGLPDWGLIYDVLKNREPMLFSTDVFVNASPEPKPRKRGFFGFKTI